MGLSTDDMSMDAIGIECLTFKERFWYPEVMSNESHWVPIAEDPFSCIGDQSLYDVKRLAIIFVLQENVHTTLQSKFEILMRYTRHADLSLAL